MNPNSPVSRRLWTMVLVFLAVGLLQAGSRKLQAEADRLYAEERCEEARPLLEKLVDGGSPTGSNLYRLAYCQRQAGENAAADATRARALDALEHDFAAAETVDTPFYLASTYRDLGRNEDMLRVAAETTELLEQGDIARPEDGVSQFQLAKLYADQQLEAPAREWYARAVDSLEAEGVGVTYKRWAGRFLGERTWKDGDYEAAQRYLGIATAGGEGTAAEYEKLAIASARTARYEQAAAAWRKAGKLEPTAADRSSYGARLADMAAASDDLPGNAPSGVSWASLDKQGLEALMREQADAVKAIQQESREQELTRELRRAYRERMVGHRGFLVRAALEYATRGHSVREASFFGGYAPLILNKRSWILPRVVDDGDDAGGERKKRKKKGRKRAGDNADAGSS